MAYENPMDEMQASSQEALESILANIKEVNKAYIQEAQDAFNQSVLASNKALQDSKKNAEDAIKELRKKQKAADEEEKARLEGLIQLEKQRVKNAEELFQQQANYAKMTKELKRLEGEQEERRQKQEREARRNKGANAIDNISSAPSRLGQKELSATQFDTKKFDEFVSNREEILNVLYEQLEVADETEKQIIQNEIDAKEREVERAKREKALANAVNNLNSTFVQEVNKAVQVLEETELKANTRLMGSNKVFTSTAGSLISTVTDSLGMSISIMDMINKNLSLSPFVKQTEVIKSITQGIQQGIVTNVEFRGYLDSIKDGIVSTFDAFDEKINRLVRVQQQDSTAARMGMEASLMKLYNAMFETSEYLQSGFDSVTDAIYEASSIVGAAQAEEMEFVLQKWLGSLYSVGMSSGTVSSLATAIGQLASGDVSGLGSGAQNLIAMALTKTNLTYDQLLTQGVSAGELNTVMYAIVDYLRDIAANSNDNNVVQKELGKVFGVQMSDIKAATNLTAQDMQTLLDYTQNYTEAQQALQEQVTSMAGRVSKSVLLSNVYENFMFTAGMKVAENPVTYFMQKILSVLPEMKIPMPQVMGSGISSEIPLRDILQTALTGFGVISAAISSIGGLASGSEFGLGLNAWNPKESVTRGAVKLGVSSGFTQQTSGSGFTAVSGGEDMKSSAMGSAAEQSEAGGKVMGTGETDVEYSASNIYKLLTGIDTSREIIPIAVNDINLSSSNDGWIARTDRIIEALREISLKVTAIELSTGLLGGISTLLGGGSSNNPTTSNDKIEIDKINEEVLARLVEVIAVAVTGGVQSYVGTDGIPVVVTNEIGSGIEGFGDNVYGQENGLLRRGAVGGNLATNYATSY